MHLVDHFDAHMFDHPAETLSHQVFVGPLQLLEIGDQTFLHGGTSFVWNTLLVQNPVVSRDALRGTLQSLKLGGRLDSSVGHTIHALRPVYIGDPHNEPVWVFPDADDVEASTREKALVLQLDL